MVPLICLLLFLVMTGHSSATYCLCKDGVSEQALQTALDYACGNGVDCSAILQNGACYNPNTVKDHCNYAVNSYFQNNGQVTGSCDFAGAATVSPNPPTNIASTCTYPSSSTGTGIGTGPGPGTGIGTTPTTGIPTGTSTAFGPSGSTSINLPNHAVAVVFMSVNNIFFTFFVTLWIVTRGF
ncbi:PLASMODESMATA CALLOSE-BINDING PROTEIN 3-like [Hibiscus syriacus]|uniref:PLASMODESMATA CALLOSE-BINDING PROTEIN 3-like n=1 Tax=Hibiscus syriacus TaxID=106335 RepID=UPI0019221603|nr:PLASMODESMATA CALLOSE-BINDING PROTEIN 3-like [Hibiscus syriacus]